MSKTTTNYKLIKPELTDVADITALNKNWDTVDTQLDLADKRFTALGLGGISGEEEVTTPANTVLAAPNGSNGTPSYRKLVEADLPALSISKVSGLQDKLDTIPSNTTYTLSKSGSTITLKGSDGSTTSVTDSDTNTTYALSSFGVTANATELNVLDGVTATTTELNHLGGVKSNIQTQLDAKAPTSSIPTRTSQLANDSGFKTTDTNTTYFLTKSGSTITLTGSDGSVTTVTDSDTNTTYEAATTSKAGLLSASDKSKLDGITASADSVAFSQSLTSGTQIGTITINGVTTKLYAPTDTNTTYSPATSSAPGLMSASDKSKLDGISTSADTVSFTRSLTSGTKIGTITINGTSTDLYCQTDTNTTYSVATSSTNGLMSASDKAKLDGLSRNFTDITSGVSAGGSNGHYQIQKAIDTGCSIMILFDGEQEFADINLTVPANLQSKLIVSAVVDGTRDCIASDGQIGSELSMFSSTFSGYGTSLEIKYM